MKVVEYRDICDAVRRSNIDYHACVDDAERVVWLRCARTRLQQSIGAECSRATSVDRERMELATCELRALIGAVEAEQVQVLATKSVPVGWATRESRASKYNRSVSRAVRLRRAARSAMRRGYF
ncbi:hypothetical protein [Burkholderia arboris]|uniref:hypothetical protein n=1 Tax=Burkholderia arboris TaxID=488730 RepID=UPI001CF16651|nr:hypothetical protein [Burkholderia arboris]MCA8050731.1 hypothetical protein [Burkholderia arboris]